MNNLLLISGIQKVKGKLSKFLVKYNLQIIVFIILFLGFRYGGTDNGYINSDGKGYYAYLPATFIYHDFTFEFLVSKGMEYPTPGPLSHVRKEVYGKVVNKYFAGVALMLLPFFLLAHFLSILFGFSTDGYSVLYLYSVLMGAIFYMWVGLLYLKKILKAFLFSENLISWLIFITVFATPVIFYTISHPSWSHIYSFAAINIFIYYAIRLYHTFTNRDLIFLLGTLGVIVLIRPSNVIIIFALPIIAGSYSKLWQLIKTAVRNKISLLSGIILFGLIVFIQLFYYYLETGHWIIWAYTDEGFNFLKPHFVEVLFSYRRGLFVYSPIILISLLGFYKLFKHDIFKAFHLLVFLFLVIYVISSWHCWWYGMCFQLRPITEFLAFFTILLGVLFQNLRVLILQWILVLLSLFCVVYNSVQIFQYNEYIMHWSLMDKEKFWHIFMRTNRDLQGLFWGQEDSMSDSISNKNFQTVYYQDFEKNNEENIISNPFGTGKVKITSYKINPFTKAFAENGFNTSDTVRYIITAKVLVLNKINGNTLFLVCSVKDESELYQYHSLKLPLFNNLPNRWMSVHKGFTITGIRKPSDTVNIYFWNKGNQKILIDNFIVEKGN